MRKAEINAELEKVNVWLEVNKLTLNTSKTKLMIFHRKPRHISDINIVINGTQIYRLQWFSFIGITLDDDLSWNAHVNIVKKKISKLIGILYRLKLTFPRCFGNLMYFFDSVIINYGLLLWGSKSHKIETLQKKAIRLITNSEFISHTNPLFIEMKILKIQDIFKLE